ncbi:MAG: hypothetical protein P8Y06_00710 [Patescibacteria group bacterium]
MGIPNILSLALGLIVFSFLITSVLVVPFIDLLYKVNLLRRKEGSERGRKSLFDKLHDKKAGTPIGGGVLIILVVTFGLRRFQKFILQWILAFITAFLLYKTLGIHILHIPLLDKTIDLGFWYVPFAALLIVTFTNAYNITDGLDGLAGGLLMIFLIAFGVIAATSLDTPLWLFIALWLGALMAFLYFNIWPARIFLGDAGALSFGATIAAIGLLTGNISALLVIGAIFLIEIISSAIQMFGWRVLKKPIFPLAPIHHTFLAIGWEEPKIVMRAWLAGIVLAIFGLWLATI